MLLLDTSAVSAVMRRAPSALARLQAERPPAVILCSPVAAELHYGLSRLVAGSRRRRLLEAEYERFREAVRWVDWTEPAATVFGRIKADLQHRGPPVDDMDLAIASVAIASGARLATANVRHFARIDGLTVEDWVEDSPSGPAASRETHRQD